MRHDANDNDNPHDDDEPNDKIIVSAAIEPFLSTTTTAPIIAKKFAQQFRLLTNNNKEPLCSINADGNHILIDYLLSNSKNNRTLASTPVIKKTGTTSISIDKSTNCDQIQISDCIDGFVDHCMSANNINNNNNHKSNAASSILIFNNNNNNNKEKDEEASQQTKLQQIEDYYESFPQTPQSSLLLSTSNSASSVIKKTVSVTDSIKSIEPESTESRLISSSSPTSTSIDQSLLTQGENIEIPRYKLRIHNKIGEIANSSVSWTTTTTTTTTPTTATNTSGSIVQATTISSEIYPQQKGYQNNDGFIETPLIDLDAPIDLNPQLLRETFNLFIQSGKRLTQMTKVYDDVEALTKLLEEKERDVELAARIGQTLLDRNQHQNERIGELEQELNRAKDKITQLRYEVSSKSDLLRFYIAKDEEEEESQEEETAQEDEFNLTSISSFPSFSKDAAQILEELEQRVNALEEENNRLKSEKEMKANDLEDEERKELILINECARRLSQTNKQIASLQEEITKKTDENQRLGKEVQNLRQQVNNLEKQIRKLTVEKEELVGALNLAHECQAELTIELIDVKEKHTNLLGAFHEKQEECRNLRQHQFNYPIFSYVDSIAYELGNSFHSGQFDDTSSSSMNGGCGDGILLNNHSSHDHHHLNCNHPHHGNCLTPDSLLSSDSFYTSSPYSSIVVTSSMQQQSNPPSEDAKPLSPAPSNKENVDESNGSTDVTKSNVGNNKTSINVSKFNRSYFLTDKLRYIKPLEGSQILNHWRRLANPNLNDLFEDKERYVSRIKANLAATEARIPRIRDSSKESSSLDTQTTNTITTCYSNNFVTTNSVFTFTTTSLSHTKETVTEVTTTFSNVQPSTGKIGYSLDKHHHSDHSSLNTINQTSLSQLHDRITLVEQVKNIMKVDQLSPISPGIITPSSKTNDKRADGLNELAKLFSLDETNKSNLLDRRKTTLLNSGSGTGNRIVTKIQMSNPKLPISSIMESTNSTSSNYNNNKNAIINCDLSKTNSNSAAASRTNLSVFRNLRKGGLI